MIARARIKGLIARVTVIREFCHDCGARQPIVWGADDNVWEAITGRTHGGGVLCPACFDRRADEARRPPLLGSERRACPVTSPDREEEGMNEEATTEVVELPPEFVAQMADLVSHRIEGIAAMGNTPFSCPIVSQIDGNLWSGGCPEPELPGYFRFVLNLYPWVKYRTAPTTEVRTVKLYDSGDMPDVAQLFELAAWVNEKRALGPTLVHCQAGLNRSGLVTALALIRAGRTPDAAIALVREKRSPAVLCNPTFERWLRGQALS